MSCMTFVYIFIGSCLNMKHSILLMLLVACVSCRKHMNVGTVLFAPSDAYKDCWSADSLALLTSRMILESILPTENTVNVNNDQFVKEMVVYFRLTLDVIRENTSGKTKHIMLVALTDVLGGYLRHYFLPLAKYSYYAGLVDYDDVVKVQQLYEELKSYLRTNGVGWTKPLRGFEKNITAKVITFQVSQPSADACKGLIFTTRASSNRRRNPARDLLEIQMPYFDSKLHPSAIAVPFKSNSLRNVESKSSAYVLVKFYVASRECLISQTGNEKSLQRYNTKFLAFLMTKVVPRLYDERFYAAFGSVMRIIETMKTMGYLKNGNVMGSFNIMPEIEENGRKDDTGDEYSDIEDRMHSEHTEGLNDLNFSQTTEKVYSKYKNKMNIILLSALSTIVLWFLVGACFICFRIRIARDKKKNRTKYIESGPRHSEESFHKTCVSSGSSKNKCSTVAGKAETCDRQTCANFASTSTSSVNQKSDSSPKEQHTPNTESPKSSLSDKDSDSLHSPHSPVQVQTVQHYPSAYACHSSLSGKYKPGSSSEEISSKDTMRKPFVFGYDFQTTSEESSPGEMSDGEAELDANMSK